MTGPESGDPRILPFQASGGPTVLRIIVGAQLRRLREARGLSAEEAGDGIRASQSKISRIETGRIGFKERDVDDLLTLYGLHDEDEREALLVLARQANVPGWWHRYGDVLPNWFEIYIGLEEVATTIQGYDVQFIPGLLQTEDYARAVVSLWYADAPEDELNRRTKLRMRRQRLLTRPHGLDLHFVIDEAALRRPLGGHQVMRAQIRRLIEMANLPNLTLQVVPFEAARQAAAGCAFSILHFVQDGMTDLVYLEQITSALYLEKPADVAEHRRIMDGLSAAALDPAASVQALQAVHDELGRDS
ncbi:helix-turn-helix transcriptional regulator [Actinocorallia longicatena]|uniref:Helix-turn-helix transcriptional regulator n=1 Tax=Actinocorallia longicatena TaxID=111803 RepID=A0ABP6Q0T8_9ACTN